MDRLRQYPLVYLGSPYSKFPRGLEAAYKDVCALTADLIREGVSAYSPIGHTHGVAIHGGLDPLDHDLWLKFDAAMMAKADALAVATMESWQDSYGLAHEIKEFHLAGKPVWFVDPVTLEVTSA